MTTEISDSFVTQFESEAILIFQRQGSLARNTVRTKNNVKGSTVTWQKAGLATVTTKARHGQVVASNASRDPVSVTLSDRYAAEWVDSLDELKIQHNEREVVAKSLAMAMGRDCDDIIFTAMQATTNANNNTSPATMTTAGAWLVYMEAMGKANIPFDGQLYAAVTFEAWADLLDIDEFSRMEYIGPNQVGPGSLWYEGVTAKRWAGFNFYPHSGLPTSGSDKDIFFYHSSAVGHAIGQDMKLDVTWQGKEQAFLFVESMSHGAVVIQDAGVIKYRYDV